MNTSPKSLLVSLLLFTSAAALTACTATPAPGPAPGPATAQSAPPQTPADPPTTSALESHQDGWQALLAALRSGEVAQVEARTTTEGYASLMKGVGKDDPAVTFERWGKGWSEWDVRWEETSDTVAQASVGPVVKEHGIRLVRDGQTWKLDRWAPGE